MAVITAAVALIPSAGYQHVLADGTIAMHSPPGALLGTGTGTDRQWVQITS